MRRLTIFTAAALAAASIGCSTATNTNVSVNRAGNANANSNVAVVVPSNSNAAMNTGTTNTVLNSNVARADYDRDRARYEADRGTSTIGQGANDSWIWFKAKSALATTNDLRDSTINVDVNNDVITLRGTVATAAQKAQAETVAKGIEGQKGIKNDLKVQPNDSLSNQATGANAGATTNANANRR